MCGDWMLKDMIGCRIMYLRLRSKSCPVPESEWDHCFNFLGFFFGVGEGVLKPNLMGRGIYLFMCYWFLFHDLQ